MAEPIDESTELFARARVASPGGVHSPVRAFSHVDGKPLFIESARGSLLQDSTGKCYVDFCMAFGPLILGHNPPMVNAALHAAIDDGWSFGTAERYSLELIELIKTQIGWIDQVRFVNSGTEAVMTALRLARAATHRDRVLKFSGCYHGHVDAMLVAAGSGMATQAASAGIGAASVAGTLVAPLDNEAALSNIFARHAQELAAVIIEPLPANYGLLPQRQAFLLKLADLCAKHGVLLIFDEVISGFRIGFGGLSEASGITPDLVTWGKIIGGGLPVGGIAGKRNLMERLAPTGDVYQAGTLSANPVAMRAGLATLRQLADGSIYRQLETLGQQLDAGIAGNRRFALARQGSVFWIYPRNEAAAPPRSASAVDALEFDFRKLFRALLKQGIYLPPSPYEVCFISAAHSSSDIEALTTALAELD